MEYFFSKKEILRKIKRKILFLFNKISFSFFKLKKINSKLIVFESEGDFSDNAYALYEHMKNIGILKRYSIIWLVDEVYKFNKCNYENTVFVNKRPKYINLKRNKALATCKYYIFDHNDVISEWGKRKDQTLIYLCHGFPGYKAGKNASNKSQKPVNLADYVITYGELSNKILPLYANFPNAKLVILGFPRLDYFFSDLSGAKNLLNKKFLFDKFNKVILWMPTFRQCENNDLSENYYTNETGLPLFNSLKDIEGFNDFLIKNNILVILKWHHLQKKLDLFNYKFSNIFFLSDYEIKEMGIQLYQFIPCSDALISDYSSISADYMLLNKPMFFILDDIADYEKSRGIIPENALDLMIGYHVFTKEQLYDDIMSFCNEKDEYEEKRKQMLPCFHKYLDGESSERILKYFDIRK